MDRNTDSYLLRIFKKDPEPAMNWQNIFSSIKGAF